MVSKNLIGRRVGIKTNSYCGHPAGTIGTVTVFNTFKNPIVKAKYRGRNMGLAHNIEDLVLLQDGSHVDKKYLKYCLENGKFKLKGL